MFKFKLLLFFTRGVSLQVWDRVGMFDREVALYQRLQQHGVEVTFITYGDVGDLQYAEKIPGINICCNRWGLPSKMYERLIPWLHRKRLLETDIIKTNQTNGAQIASVSAKQYDKPLIARCGYMWSEFTERLDDVTSDASHIEELVFKQANTIVVTTQEMQESIIRRMPDVRERIVVIANYVDTDLFRPALEESKAPNKLCYVGRLDQKQKNIRSLLEAVKGLDVNLQIIGSGPLEAEIAAEALKNPWLEYVGQVPNSEIPGYLRQCTAFVFPSFYEGHPKTLIEAMSCGLPVVTTDVPGIGNMISHKQTGWLCRTDAELLRAGIVTILTDAPLRKHLAKQARQYVVENYALDRIVTQELEIYQNTLKKNTA